MGITHTDVNKQLIYIASDDRSGSTMLDYMLSNNDQICSVGEFHNLKDHINRKGHGSEWNWNCSCGEPLARCPVWSKTAEMYQGAGRGNISEAETIFMPEQKFRFSFLLAVIILLVPTKGLKNRLLNYSYRHSGKAEVIKNSFSIIDVFSAINKKNIIVESSKLPHRLYALLELAPPEYSIKVIHLVRDVRGVAHSKIKRADKKGSKPSYLILILAWVCRNIEVLNIRACLPKKDSVLIRYEKLCGNPAETMRHICDRLQLTWDGKMTLLSRIDKHQIGGSTRRFEASTEIKIDERWKSDLSSYKQLLYVLFGKALNKTLNYDV